MHPMFIIFDFPTINKPIEMMFPANLDQIVCDPIVPIQNFEISKFAGTWYEQQHVIDP